MRTSCHLLLVVSGLQAGGSPEGLSAKQLMDTAMSDSGWDMESGIKDARASTEDTHGQGILDTPSRSRQTPAWASAQPHRVQNTRQVSYNVHTAASVKTHDGMFLPPVSLTLIPIQGVGLKCLSQSCLWGLDAEYTW